MSSAIAAVVAARRRNLQFRVVTLAIFATFLSSAVFAQAPTGTLQGRAADPAGASIPEAKVSIENQATGVKQALITNSEGRFVQPYLSSGDYRLTVEKVGFSRNVINDIKVDVQQTVSLDVVLKVGELSTTVEVKAEVAQLKTETS